MDQHASEERTHDATEEHRGDIEACGNAMRVESFFEALDGAINDSAVEAKQKATDGGYEAYDDNKCDASGVLLHGFTEWFFRCLRNWI